MTTDQRQWNSHTVCIHETVLYDHHATVELMMVYCSGYTVCGWFVEVFILLKISSNKLEGKLGGLSGNFGHIKGLCSVPIHHISVQSLFKFLLDYL